MAKHLEFGRACEDSALKYFLEEFPAQLVARNYRCKMGELDLIFEVEGEQGCELVVVEVRGRVRGAMVDAVESVGPKKLLKIQNTVRHFVMNYQGPARSVRLDVMAWNDKSLSHVRDIWLL
jgi:putative endonuclease